jgi:hypothetical protein
MPSAAAGRSHASVVEGAGDGIQRGRTFRANQSGLILADRITLLHFSVSSPMSLLKSAGEPLSRGAIKSAIVWLPAHDLAGGIGRHSPRG